MAFTRRETAILIIGDFILLIASLWAALLIRNLALPAASYFLANLLPFLPVFLLSLAVFYIAGLYEKQTAPVRRVMSERIAGAQLANAIIAALLFFVLPFAIAPKTILAIYLVVSIAAVSLWRSYRLGREIKREGRVSAALVGRGAAARELFEEVNGGGRYLIRFNEWIDTERLAAPGALSAAVARALLGGARILVLDTRDPVIADDLPMLYDAMTKGASFVEFAQFYEELFDRVPLAHIDYAWLFAVVPARPLLYDIAKRAFDLFFAAAGSVVALPFILLAALLLAPSGPPFIFNERVGKGGRVFTMIKLRTMLFNDQGDPMLRAKNRVTALGRFLRQSRIDELPQLWNVLLGDVSFIGPRPELPAIAAVYEREIPFYQIRHLIPPGLSGWAQIRDYDAPRGGPDVEKTRTKLSYDLYYLKHRSFGLDLSIAAKTLRALASFSGK
ncbi:MAG TPA: sugar transferase [Candidatus Paceibacterota bacterium]|nr:sugar transferase [Candidatus Paceibacterota bacterium]